MQVTIQFTECYKDLIIETGMSSFVGEEQLGFMLVRMLPKARSEIFTSVTLGLGLVEPGACLFAPRWNTHWGRV